MGHRFADGSWAFRRVDFSVAQREIVVLAGRNGAGKTILAKCLAGLRESTEGAVLFEGKDLAAYKESPASRVGYVFQDSRLQAVGDTVVDDASFGPANLGMNPSEAKSRAEAAIARCGLESRALSFVHTLSGGESRRLAVAGIVAMGPLVVILDEPFANLDRDGVRSVLEIIVDLAQGGTAIVVVTHELEKVLGIAARLDIMDGGSIAASGTPVEVLATGIERYGLRDPLRPNRGVEDLQWLE
ncbi:MAG: ABC transporter ATP-binding protein [Spirochaetaceae bacterium]|nr:ABC transporter ATP-binding protein [Spirochaetaceae bacterium]